ncbi:replication protein A 70 kDa DNA-binding subunit C [Selaginella moellendorffii]|uniref:replication protein A 70 kDa DNA-binding subunit C n=1 Tax=Selaginella moellendorffii TaxID=88036 RepID=UPI000D1C9BCD|nr:replication protein A 70 kDa DNA-binding subunit C [Selaginella moellendorffii]|eukprot:XP_024522449.1 replication protein A 70 kDa DNA-binding subunit C [Selaginella moellendorffii]
MSFDVVDVQGTEIRIIGSDDCALVLSDKIVQGTVYSFSGSGGIRRSNQAYTPFEVTWEIQANKGMEFTALDEDATFPRIVLAKTSILSACQKERDSFVDVVGIVIWIGTITVTSRDSGTFVKKRTLCLGDDSGHSVDLCLWDLKAEEEGSYIQERIDSGVQPIICVKGGKVSDYNGKSLSAIGVSTILIEPEMEAVADLREWMTLYYNVTNFIHLSTSSSRQTVSCTTTLSEISNMQLKVLESSPIYRVIATVKEMKTDEFYYNACINVLNARQCGKKTTRTADGWFCSYCNIESANMEFKYALKMCIEDSSSHVWAIAFQEAAQEIVGMSAKELATMRDENYPAFSLLIDGIRSKIYKFKIWSKLEKYQDMEKLRFYILGLDT